MAIIPPISAFVAAGFEHSVANLVPVTIGNIIGGAVMVGPV